MAERMATAEFQERRAKTQAGDIYDQLRADILACRIEPGSKLRINDFVDRFGVSLGAVREALSKLSSEGLVISTAQKGFSVASVSKAELLDLTQTRIEIELICLKAAMERGDVDWETGIVAAFHRLSRLTERNQQDPSRLDDKWAAAHSDFHEMLVATCESPVKLRIRKALYEQSERYRRLSVPVRKQKRNVNAEHKAIMDAALARDTETACRLMAAHIQLTTDILLKAPFLA